jgi:hypothetical protein
MSERMWNVSLSGDYVTLITTVEARTRAQAIKRAALQVTEYYGWDVSGFDADADPMGY